MKTISLLIPILAFSIAAGCWGFTANSLAAQQPVNRLGAHFDRANHAETDRREQFQQAVAETTGTYHPSVRTVSNINPGLPLDSAGHRQFERPSLDSTSAPTVSHPSKTSGAQVTSVGFGRPRQETNSFGGFGQTPQAYELGNASGQSSNDGFIDLSPCTVEFIDDIELPAQESGQIKKLFVKEGSPVTQGKIVGQIDDELYLRMLEQAKLRLAIAEQKANDSTSVMAAENEISLAGIEYKRTQSLAARGSKSESEREKAEFSLKLAMLKKVAAQNEKDSAYGESKIEMARVREVEERIRRHSLLTNFDGYVIEIFRHPLEWVNSGDKVIRVARMDRLWVQGIVSTDERNPYEILNRPVTVTLNLARGETAEFKGKIVNVGLERQGTNQILVKAEIENRPVAGHWVLQPNSTVRMRIHLNQQSSNTALDSPSLPTQR